MLSTRCTRPPVLTELAELTVLRGSIITTQIEVLADDDESALTEREDFDRQFFSLVALTRSLLGVSFNGAGSEAGFKDADSGKQTAMVNVISATGKKYAARLLLDNGSTANFITQSLSEKLGLSLSGASTKRGSEAWIPGPHQG
ncbi:unnamed protein product, partial [Brenthis ino]